MKTLLLDALKGFVTLCLTFALAWPIVMVLSGFLDKPVHYEYKTLSMPVWSGHAVVAEAQDAQGWELVTIDRGLAYFRRKKH